VVLNNMCGAGLVACALIWSGSASAATIVNTYRTDFGTVRLPGGPATGYPHVQADVISVTPFDASLGTLSSVRVDSTAFAIASLRIAKTQACVPLIPFTCFPAGGEILGQIGTRILDPTIPVGQDSGLLRLSLSDAGFIEHNLVLTYTNSQNLSDPGLLLEFQDAGDLLEIRHLYEAAISFDFVSVVGSEYSASSSFQTTVTYEYIPFSDGGGKPGTGGPGHGAIPEPATWATMIVGFGLTGSVLRGRRPSRCEARDAWPAVTAAA
jgi:hypothetical protein